MTYKELSYFTHDELSNLTYGEMSMPLNELLDKLVDENRPVPIMFYQKLCDHCDGINIGKVKLKEPVIYSETNIIINKPKNKAIDFFEKIALIYTLIEGIEYLQEKFSEIWDWISSRL